MDLSDVLSRFEHVKPVGGDKYSARCPGPGHDHGDRHNSLTIYVNKTAEGQDAVYFQCGLCSNEEIANAVGLEPQDLFLGNSPSQKTEKQKSNSANKKPKITSEKYVRPDTVAPLRAYDRDEYPYTNADGQIVAKKIRKEGKHFYWNPKKSEVLEAEGSFPVVFRFDRLVKSKEGETIYICEGEKDVLTLESYGQTAICLPYGAQARSDFKELKENKDFQAAINGKKIIILPDFDFVGETSAQNLRRALYGIQKERSPIAVIGWKSLEPDICKLTHTDNVIHYEGAGFDLTDYLELHPEDGIARILEEANANLRAAALKAKKAEEKKAEKAEKIQEELNECLEPITDLLAAYPGLETFFVQYSQRVGSIEEKKQKDITDKDRQIRHDYRQALKEAQKLYEATLSTDEKIKSTAIDVLTMADAIIVESVLIEDIYPVRVDKSALLQLIIDKKYAYTHDGRLWLYDDAAGIFNGYAFDGQGELLIKYTKIFGNESIYSKKNIDEFKSLIKNMKDSKEDDLLAPVRPEMRYIAFKNGTFDLKARKLVDHSPDHLLTCQINANFDNEFYNSSMESIKEWVTEESHFYRMLKQIQPDPVDQMDIMMHFGLVMSPHATTGKIPLICYYGSGTNGKGTLLDIMMRLIVDERSHNANLPWERLVSRRGFDLSKLDGKSVNLVPDTSSPTLNRESDLYFGAVKSMITGESFAVEHKYADAITIHPNITNILCLNRLPHIAEKGPSTEKRFHILPFNRRIGSESEVREGKKDLVDQDRNALVEDVLREKDRLVVLFVLALYKLEENNWKLPESESYTTTKLGWLSDSDPIQDFCVKYLRKTPSLKDIPKDQRVDSLENYSFSLDEFVESIKCFLLIKGVDKRKLPTKDVCRHQIEQIQQIKPERKLLPDGTRPTRYYGYSLSSWRKDRINRYHLDDPDKYDKLLMGRYNPAWETQVHSGNDTNETTAALLSQKDQQIAALKEELNRMRSVIDALKQATIDEHNNNPYSEDPLDGFQLIPFREG